MTRKLLASGRRRRSIENVLPSAGRNNDDASECIEFQYGLFVRQSMPTQSNPFDERRRNCKHNRTVLPRVQLDSVDSRQLSINFRQLQKALSDGKHHGVFQCFVGRLSVVHRQVVVELLHCRRREVVEACV